MALYVKDFSDQNEVITRLKKLGYQTAEGGNDAIQQRHFMPAAMPLRAGETVFVFAIGKARGYVLLLLAKNINGDGRAGWQIAQKTRSFIDAYQNERRIKGYRSKRTYGHAIRASVVQHAGYHRYTGRE
jgi:hypothetical protein